MGREELRLKKQDTSEQTSHGGLFKVKKHHQQIETLQFHDGVSRPVCHTPTHSLHTKLIKPPKHSGQKKKTV